MSGQSSYAQAGVDIAKGHRAAKLMKQAVQSTYGPEVLSDVGSFGGLYDAAAVKALANPVLVASTDGVGTKTKVAQQLARWDGIGHDIVNHCVNDILVQGARPLFFLDYVASSVLDPQQIATIVGGMAAACRAARCALIGGETAEMPAVYTDGAIDVVGTVVGLIDREQLVDGQLLQAGDVILGLPSSGLHTNGYTLARTVLRDLDWTSPRPELGDRTIGDALLAPHVCYLDAVDALLAGGVPVRGLAHITGGGLVDNPPRIFPDGLGARLQRDTWTVPPIFDLIQQHGRISDGEMVHVFNMGLGMLVFVPADEVAQAMALLPEASVVGEMIPGSAQVAFV